MDFSKPALALGFACVGTALFVTLAVDRKDGDGQSEPKAPPSKVLAAAEAPEVSPPAPVGASKQDSASDLDTPGMQLGSLAMEALRPRPRPAEVVRPSAPVRPKPRPEVNIASKLVAAPRPKPRDPLADPVARRRLEWSTLETHATATATELASRRARLLAQAESLVEAPPRRTLRNATALTCLAVSVYHEARNQPELGQHAVAAVILRRAEIPHRWEDTVCEVVRPIQFSYLDADLGFAEIDEPAAWREAVAVAASALLHGPHPGLAKADHYHRLDVDPVWNETMEVVARVADHVFLQDVRTQRIE